MFTKKNRIGTSPLADFEVPHTIQPGEHSIGSGTEGVMYEWRRAVNANWNDDGWNINANAVDNPNPWNAGNDVVSRYPFLSSLGALSLGEFFAINPLRHPPIIFPTSSIRTLNSSNCLFGISFDSHAICAKNRNESVIPTARVSRGTFSRIPAYVATRNDSSRSSNRVSIFAPMPNRSSRPILRRIGNHKRYNVFVCSTTGKIRAGGGVGLGEFSSLIPTRISFQ